MESPAHQSSVESRTSPEQAGADGTSDRKPLRYDQLALVGLHRWWIPPLSLLAMALIWLLAFGGMSGLETIVTTVVPAPFRPSSEMVDVVTTLGAIALFTPATLVTVR